MKLWGGRFESTTDETTDSFHSSIYFDKRLYEEDILGSIAHANMLRESEIITKFDAEEIVTALNQILIDIQEGKIEFDPAAEDIHMNIESILINRIGDAGKKLHTARSRNDQVALDLRMYIKKEITEINILIVKLMNTLISLAKDNIDTIMPGYTHMQKAQPITFAHHLSAYVEMFLRDYDRLVFNYKLVNVSPLGSGALATTTYPINRSMTACELDFEKVARISLDAVSDRDFCIDLLSSLSIVMMHLSRFCEEVVLWSTDEFKFIELSDSYSTGSSIMPQKKNPDMAELIRGKTGRVYGSLMTILTIMKSLPLAYNKDMQEDKEPVFDAIDTVKQCLTVFDGMISTMSINKNTMLNSAKGGFTNATDCADWLVKNGMPFRDAHEVIGKIVLYCIEKNKTLEQLTIEEYKDINPLFNETIYDAIDIKNCVDKRSVYGGPSKIYITKYLEDIYTEINNNRVLLKPSF